MPIADKEFFIAHYNEVKNILNNCGVTRCGLNFEPNKTQVLLEFKDKKIFYKVEEALMNLCNQCETAYTVSLSAFSAKGQPLLSSKTAIDFEDLKPKVDVDINDEVKVIQGKEQVIQASNIANKAAKVLVNLSKTIQSSSDIEMVYKTTNLPALVNSLSEFINLWEELEKKLHTQHSESRQNTSVLFTPT